MGVFGAESLGAVFGAEPESPDAVLTIGVGGCTGVDVIRRAGGGGVTINGGLTTAAACNKIKV